MILRAHGVTTILPCIWGCNPQRKAVIRIECLALSSNDAMGNVVAIAEDDCRPGFHGEFLWRIDVHLHLRRPNRKWRNGGESGDTRKHLIPPPPAGVATPTISYHIM